MLKLSKASKMPCLSWSLPAFATCPGAVGDDGRPVGPCSRCYALTGRYLFGSVRAVREHNLSDWKREGWCDDMVAALAGEAFFRWFDSGDCYSVDLAEKILEVIRRTPWCRHWLPTRSRKVPAILKVLRRIAKLPNAVVRHSSDTVTGDASDVASFVQRPEDAPVGKGVALCTSSRRGGKCGPCRACWSPAVATIYYPAHGGAVSDKTFQRLEFAK
jgi:hypothetical protein